MIQVTDQTIDKFLGDTLPAVIDFWAPWCGPCKHLKPILEELSNEYEGRVNFLGVDVDTNPELSDEYKVRGIPTLFFVKDGVIVDTLVGSHPKENITKILDDLIK